MYIRKTNGPNTDPWGMSLVLVDMFELKPLVKTDCLIQTIY